MKDNLYFRNISRRWKKEASKSEELVFFSPYITSSTAETVLLHDAGPDCTIYTCFKAENFACRASSLKTLKNLIQSGCELFHIEDLHAKVMLSEDFISIGSQNLTNSGRTNLEATFSSQDPSYIRHGQNAIEDWVNLAKEITLEMIEDMEDEVSPLIVEYDKIKELFNTADNIVAEKETTRQKVEAKRIKEIRENNARLRQLAVNAGNIIQSSRSIHARVKLLQNQGKYGDVTFTYSLVPWGGSFLFWDLGGKKIELKRQNRYLFMDIESGRVSWARINKGRITYFSDVVSTSDRVSIGRWLCKLNFKSNWSNVNFGHNLTITITYLRTNIELVYKCHFDLNFLTNIYLNIEKSKNHIEADEIIAWNEKHCEEFSDSIAHHILSPFLYNRKLLGKQADDFFVSPLRYRYISLGLIKGFPVLLSK